MAAMSPLTFAWATGAGSHELRLIRVPGTNGKPFLFGGGEERRAVEVADFHIGATPVTQALWAHVMGSNPAVRPCPQCPAENVSWDHVCQPDGFLDRINRSDILSAVSGAAGGGKFRLPSESEWEYAARGGPHWTDGLTFSGSNDPGEVAWYGHRFSRARRLGTRLLGWPLGWRIFGRRPPKRTRTHEVADKAPNQLGIYDMCGNVWEWCQDVCTGDLEAVPADGSAWLGEGTERRLRGGCHHNWDIHCTVSFRYGIDASSHDGCIGFRLVLA